VRLGAGIYETVSGPVRLTITDVTAHTGRLDAWVEVHHGTRRLTFGDLNLRGARTVSTLARSCAEALPAFKFPWLEWLSEGCYEVVHDTLEGEPPVELTTADAQPPGWIVQDLVGDDGATSLVGFGQTGKSMIALAAACTVASGDDVWLGLTPLVEGNVLYLDWEASIEPHRWRLAQLCQGANRPAPRGIHHRREALPLYRGVTAIARHAAHLDAQLIVVDSVMLARGGGDTYGHEGTLNLYAALAQIGRPCLLIDHRAKPSRDPKMKDDPAPWGSIINFNSLRLAFSVNTMASTDGIDITLKRIKSNYHGRSADLSWRLLFEDRNRSARFEQSFEPLLPGGEGTTTDRIMGLLLRDGQTGCSVKELAREVGSSESSVRGLLSRLKQQGRVHIMGGMWLAESQDRQEEAPF
jgi:hypothetical protein